MLDQVYSTNSKNLFCSVVILFLRFEGLYKSLSKAFLDFSVERLSGQDLIIACKTLKAL